MLIFRVLFGLLLLVSLTGSAQLMMAMIDTSKEAGIGVLGIKKNANLSAGVLHLRGALLQNSKCKHYSVAIGGKSRYFWIRLHLTKETTHH